MTTKMSEALEKQIERLVREHLEGQQMAARAAVERAFAATAREPRAEAPRRGVMSSRRAPSEMAELAEQLFAAVQTCPGETMKVIAARVGEKALALNLPMQHLKRAGRVRSAGERSLTRYFPMTAAKSA
jgi:plasmid stabilization system protein ParE